MHSSVDVRNGGMPTQKARYYFTKFCGKYRLFMKLQKTSDINIVRACQHRFGFEIPSVLLARRTRKFLEKNEKFMSCGEYSKIDYSLIVMFLANRLSI